MHQNKDGQKEKSPVELNIDKDEKIQSFHIYQG